LRFTPHDFSPSVLGKIVRASARQLSFKKATEALEELAEVTISVVGKPAASPTK
jgi:hypothetical protein